MAIKAMIIDDSAVVRKHLSDLLTAGGIDVVATAQDPVFAWPKLDSAAPDVIVLDVEMPRMDGITFLRKLMAERPTPVVMCSTLTEAGCETTMQALAAGAVSFVTKPRLGLREFLGERSNGLVDAVKAAAKANLKALPRSAPAPAGGKPAPRPFIAPPTVQGAMAETTDRVVVIGVSTGGVQSTEVVLRALPRNTPGIMIVQHMPEKFTASYASRLNSLCEIDVMEAKDGDRLIPGRALIAPGGKHMRMRRSGAQYLAEVVDGPLINHHRPSVDVLFRSVAAQAGRNAIGVIMTGMGDDGARGLKEMHEAGAVTAAQDEASCVVFGMPKEAIRLGGVDHVLPLNNIAEWILHTASQRTPAKKG